MKVWKRRGKGKEGGREKGEGLLENLIPDTIDNKQTDKAW